MSELPTTSSCAEKEPFALQVLGDSMLPEFSDGVVVTIDPGGVIKDECYVVAVYEDEYIFRQLKIVENRYYLQPLNDLYDTVEVRNAEAIIGVITQQAGKRRKDHKHY